MDDGSTVSEEQEVLFTEKRVIWLPAQGKDEIGEEREDVIGAVSGGEKRCRDEGCGRVRDAACRSGRECSNEGWNV